MQRSTYDIVHGAIIKNSSVHSRPRNIAEIIKSYVNLQQRGPHETPQYYGARLYPAAYSFVYHVIRNPHGDYYNSIFVKTVRKQSTASEPESQFIQAEALIAALSAQAPS